MNKETVLSIYDGILAFEREEILPYATTWIDPEDIMFSEISQTKKDKYCMISLLRGI